MARLKQLEPKKETIGGLNFYIRPFPAMVAANLTGDLASLLTPVLAALMPLVGDSDNEGDDEDGDLMDIDVNDAAASISKSMEGFSGSKVESMMKKLLMLYFLRRYAILSAYTGIGGFISVRTKSSSDTS